MDEELRTPAPREIKIRRGIVLFGSFQTLLGAVIIAMSFTAFACSSSEKIRRACPYWAGFTVLFTGSVGFLTWRQLSVVSIGIYTFLSAVSVIVHLVATVLTGDVAGFLKSLHDCKELPFEHACGCCIMNANNGTCSTRLDFQSVRDCDILGGFLKDIMYGLCAVNVLCCLISLIVTVLGCTLVTQYNRYTQTMRLHWSRHAQLPIQDHRYAWSPFSSEPINGIPPCAPPIYIPVQTGPGDCEAQRRRPLTVFDPVDFPPPYSSREPSLAGRQESYDFLGMTYPLESPRQGRISWDQHAEVEYQRSEGSTICGGEEVCSTSRTLSSCVGPHEVRNDSGVSSMEASGLYESSETEHSPDLSSIRAIASREDIVTEPPQDTQIDDDFCGSLSCDSMRHQESGSRCSDSRNRACFYQRRHSCPHFGQVVESDAVYSVFGEVYQLIVDSNLNQLASSETASEQVTEVLTHRGTCRYQKGLRRANSTPFYHTGNVAVVSKTFQIPVLGKKEGETSGDGDFWGESSRQQSLPKSKASRDMVRDANTGEVIARGETSGESISRGETQTVPCETDTLSQKTFDGLGELGAFFRHCKDTKLHKKRRRPRNNPDHILERETASGKENCVGSENVSCRVTDHVEGKETTV